MHRPLKVFLVDGSSQTVIINDTKNVREISDMIGEKLKLQFPDNFCLRRTLPNYLSSGVTDKSKIELAQRNHHAPW